MHGYPAVSQAGGDKQARRPSISPAHGWPVLCAHGSVLCECMHVLKGPEALEHFIAEYMGMYFTLVLEQGPPLSYFAPQPASLDRSCNSSVACSAAFGQNGKGPPSLEADLRVRGGCPGTCKRGPDHRGFQKRPPWFLQPRCPVTLSSLPPWSSAILLTYTEAVRPRVVVGPQKFVPDRVGASHWVQRPQ